MTRSAFVLALLLAAASAIVLADDLDDSYQSLQDAVSKKDPELVKKLAAQTAELARKAIAAPAPAAADEQDAWKKHVEYAKTVESYTEYALYATATQSEAPVMVDLMATLEAQNPKSKFLDEGYGAYLVAVAKAGGEAKVLPLAEKAIANFPQNPDLLLVLMESAMTRKQSDRALSFANRLIAAGGKRTKPEGEAAADWERSRSTWLGHGYWTAGSISTEKGLYAAADRDLRASLPLIKGDDYRTGVALFYLGVANYQVGKATLDKKKVLEAAQFSDEAAKFNTPVQHQAWANAQLMRTDAGKMR